MATTFPRFPGARPGAGADPGTAAAIKTISDYLKALRDPVTGPATHLQSQTGTVMVKNAPDPRRGETLVTNDRSQAQWRTVPHLVAVGTPDWTTLDALVPLYTVQAGQRLVVSQVFAVNDALDTLLLPGAVKVGTNSPTYDNIAATIVFSSPVPPAAPYMMECTKALFTEVPVVAAGTTIYMLTTFAGTDPAQVGTIYLFGFFL